MSFNAPPKLHLVPRNRSVAALFALVVTFVWNAPVEAVTILRSAYQQFQSDATVIRGGNYFLYRESQRAGVPGSRTYDSGDLNGTNSHARSLATETATADDDSITFSGRILVAESGISVGATSSVSHLLSYEIVGQDEMVTVSVANATIMKSGASAPEPSYTLVGHGFNSCAACGPIMLQSPGTHSITLPPGNYALGINAAVSLAGSFETLSSSLDFSDTISFTNLTFAPGWSQQFPLLPDSFTPISMRFLQVPRRTWADPVAVNQFDFKMTGNSHFTEIMSFPTGFMADFEVVVDGDSLGFFGPDRSVNFTTLLGHGVSAFSVRNIVPTVDGNDPVAFPIMLDFDTEFADFTMTPVSADFDANGVVDGTDFLTWQRGVGLSTGATPAQGDANKDAAVDAADLGLWKRQFASDIVNVNPMAVVPEPRAIALALVVIMSAIFGVFGGRSMYLNA